MNLERPDAMAGRKELARRGRRKPCQLRTTHENLHRARAYITFRKHLLAHVLILKLDECIIYLGNAAEEIPMNYQRYCFYT